MKKPKQSEKFLLKEIAVSAQELLRCQRGIEIGSLIAMIRKQLIMSLKIGDTRRKAICNNFARGS